MDQNRLWNFVLFGNEAHKMTVSLFTRVRFETLPPPKKHEKTFFSGVLEDSVGTSVFKKSALYAEFVFRVDSVEQNALTENS